MDGVTWVCKLAHTSTGSILLPVLPSPSNSYWSIRSVSGDSVDIIFIRSSTQPLTPEDSLGLPLGWFTDVEGATPGSGTVHTLWSSIGTKNSAEGLYTWNTPVQVEGQSIAEVTVYTRGVPSSTPTGGTYRFDATPGIEVLPTSSWTTVSTWHASIPAGSTPLYVSKAVVSAYGNNGEAPITGWTVPVISMRDGEGYILVVESSNGNVFKTDETQTTILSAILFKNGTDITSLINSSRFKWTRQSRVDNATPNDATWNSTHLTGYKTISLSSSEVLHSATFFCEVEEE